MVNGPKKFKKLVSFPDPTYAYWSVFNKMFRSKD